MCQENRLIESNKYTACLQEETGMLIFTGTIKTVEDSRTGVSK
jgi:hypothetical protein